MVAVDTFTNVMRAIAFGLALGLLTFALVWAIQEWTQRFRSKRKRPWDYEIDGECSPSETHVKIVPYAYDEIVWPKGPAGPAYHRSWRK